MAAQDFVRRSMQIVARGFLESTTDYFDNAVTFINDAKEVKTTIIQGGKDAKSTFSNMRHSGIGKKFRDWFYNEGGMFGDFDFDDDDFDAGFDDGDASDESGEHDSSKPLTQDSMVDVARKQTGAMYKAFGHAADLHMANTAEIVSTLNSRSAELTASVNNINSTLIQIGKRLDLIVEYTSSRTKQEEKEDRKNSIFDYGGGLSISGISTAMKEQFSDSMFASMFSMGKTMLGSGMLTPENLLSMVLSQTVLDKKFKGLGNKSVNDIGEAFNDAVGEAIQNGLTKVLTSKNGFLNGIFGDIISGPAGKDFGAFAKNQYNEKPAVFDGMTRKSIITIIPGYLNEILKAVTKSDGMSIDKKGNLTTKKTDHFINEVSDNLFKSGSMSYSQRKEIYEKTKAYDPDIKDSEISEAIRALTGSYLWYMYRTGRKVLEIGEITDITRDSTRQVLSQTAYILSTQTGKTEEYWLPILQHVVYQIDEGQFRQELQRLNERAFKNLSDFAKHNVHNSQARRINAQEFLDAYKHSYAMYNDTSTAQPTPTNPASPSNPTNPAPPTPPTPPTNSGNPTTTTSPISPITSSTVGGMSGSLRITTTDYLAGICTILNRGVNVYVTGTGTDQKKRFGRIDIRPGMGDKPIISGAIGNGSDSTGPSITDAGKGIKDFITGRSSSDNQNRSEDEKRLQELKEKPEDELTDDEKKEMKDLQNKVGKNNVKGLFGSIKSKFESFRDNTRTVDKSEGGGIKSFLSDLIPQSLKDMGKRFGETDTGKSISNSKVVNKVKELGGKANKKIFGEESTNELGETVRTGGLIHKAIVKSDDAIDRAMSGFTSTKNLEKKYNKLYEDNQNQEKSGLTEDQIEDQNTMRMIQTQSQGLMADKDVSQQDLQEMTRLINSLHDKKLKRQLNRTLVPMLRRTGNSIKMGDAGLEAKDEKKGLLGSIFGAFKIFLRPVLTYVKTVVGGIFLLIKNVGKKLISFAMKGVKGGLQRIHYGAKSVASGAKDMFSIVTSGAQKAIKWLNKPFEVLKKGLSAATDFVKDKFSNIIDGFKKKREDKDGASSGDGSEKKGILGRAKDKLSGIAKNAGDKFRSTSFGQGFMQARDERKAANEKRQEAKKAAIVSKGPESFADAKAEDMANSLSETEDILTSEDENGKGIFKPIIKIWKDILQAVSPKEDKPEGAEGGSEGGEESQTDETNTPSEESTNTTENANGGGGSDNSQTPETPSSSGDSSSDQSGSETPTPSTGGGQSQPSPEGGAGGGGTDAGEGGGKKGGKLGGALGKMLGGITSMLGGVLQVVLSIVMSLEGFKALYKLVLGTLTKSLKPLNKAFQAIMKAVKPIIKQLGGIISMVAEFVVKIVEAVVDIIQPILEDVVQPVLEALTPLLDVIISTLSPILSVIGVILKVCLIPLMVIMKYYIMPAIDIISGAVQVILGVLQIGFGGVMAIIGSVVQALGMLPFPGFGSIKKTGQEMTNQGVQFMTDGAKSIVDGGKQVIKGITSYGPLGMVKDVVTTVKDAVVGDNEEDKEKPQEENKNIVETTYANGDTNTYIYNNGSNDIYNTYGGEYQRGMGGYLNMDQRGCGPIALADAYNRRGGNMSARSLASSMAGTGAYSPSRGTSVGAFMDTSRSLGMNVRAGGVTSQSLKMASPTNPITVVGSGSDYGTRKGNNHFMNVIGSDRHGGVYVSNPLTGRVDRKPASTVAGSAVMGIYGSGDEGGTEGYTFPDAIREAFQALKEQANKILGLFTMEKSDEEEANDMINEEQNKMAIEDAKKQLGEEEYKKYEEEAELKARADYEKDHPKMDGQSDDDYDAAFQKWYSTRKANYIAQTELVSKAQENKQNFWTEFESSNSKLSSDFADSIKEYNQAINTAGSSGGGVGGPEAFAESTAEVFEGLVNTYPDIQYANYQFGDISTRSGNTVANVRPDCSGMISAAVVNMGYKINNSANDFRTYDFDDSQVANQTLITNADGSPSTDWQVLPFSSNIKQAGDILIDSSHHMGMYIKSQNGLNYGFDAGTTNGIFDSAEAGTIFLDTAGTITDRYPGTQRVTQSDDGSGGWSGAPDFILRYIKPRSSGGEGTIDMSDMLRQHSIWSSYKNNIGVPKFIEAGVAAGMSPAEIAALMSTGIWEDSGQKIFGIKSLNDTTYDVNGQAAKGIMNWVDQDVAYGNTVLDQLKWIHKTYFDEGSTDYRATFRDNGYVDQDTAAFKEATGRSGFKLKIGDKYGPYANQDLTEGSAQFFRNALVPVKIHTAIGMAENVGTAVDAYNWMLDNGYATFEDGTATNSSGVSVDKTTYIGGAKVNSKDGIVLFENPTDTSDQVCTVGDGSKVLVFDSGKPGWYRITYKDKAGYVRAGSSIAIDKDEQAATAARKKAEEEARAAQHGNGGGNTTQSDLLAYAQQQTGGLPGAGNFTDHTGDNRWYKSGDTWKQDKQVFEPDDPRWRSAYYSSKSPYHYISTERDTYDNLGHMMNMATSKSLRGGNIYKNMINYWDDLGTDVAEDVLRDFNKDLTTGDDWWSFSQKYRTGKKKEKEDFIEVLNSLQNSYFPNNKLSMSQMETRVKGSGDVSESDFWDTYLGWNNNSSFVPESYDIPPVDENVMSQYTEDSSMSPVVVNRYNIQRTDDKDKEEYIRAILTNTYNVRSESIEAILQAILIELKKKKDAKGTTAGTNASTKLFDERIPEQVAKLSIG